MSVGSFVCTGIGGRSIVALFVTEGFGQGVAAAPVSVVLGGIPKRRGKRFEITINDQRFVAHSVPALEAMVTAWRKAHPANDRAIIAAPPSKPRVSREAGIPAAAPIAEVVQGLERRARESGEDVAGSNPALGGLLGPSQSELAIAAQSFAAEQARRAQEEALQREIALAAAKAAEEEESDLEALVAILLEAA